MNRDYISKIDDPSAAKAILEFSEMYGHDTMRWLANLWSPAFGAFYYSNSARDYEGFLPDVESTAQALRVIASYGMVDSLGGIRNALPPEMIGKLVAFVREMADADGYFYHRQWGKVIPTSRRGRDLGWAMSLLDTFGASAPYPTALDLLADKESNAPALPEYMRSRATLFDYLESLDFPHRSYPAANLINAQMSQFRAAGMLDDICDWLDDHQLPDTGLWQEGVDYLSISGLMKLGSTYNAAGRCPRYIERAVDSAFEVAMSDERPGTVCYIYNPLSAMTSMRKSYLACGMTAAASDITARARKIAVPLIRKTAEKVSIFRKSDGSFSMTPEFSSPNSQLMPVALPRMNEGDINATTIAINGVFGGVSGALDYGVPKLYDGTDFRLWLDMVGAVRVAPKRPIPDGTIIKYYNPV